MRSKRAKLAALADADTKLRQELRTRADQRLSALGSGSDFSVFADHLGIASLNIGYGGEDEAGQYHSIYDDFHWYTAFEDTNFAYGRTIAQTIGTMVMRMADADVLPFQFTNFADTVHEYLGEVKTLAGDMRDRAKEREEEDDGATVIHERERFSQRLTLLYADGRIALLSEKPSEIPSRKEDRDAKREPADGQTDVCPPDAGHDHEHLTEPELSCR